MLRKFSNRRTEIERDADGSQDNPATMAGAALSTRRAMREVDVPAVERAVADALGPELFASVRERVDGQRVELAPSGFDAEALAEHDGLTQMANTFSRNNVIIAVARSAPQGMHAADVLEQTNDFLPRSDIVHLEGGRYTTTDLLETETARKKAQLGRADARAGLATDRALWRGRVA